MNWKKYSDSVKQTVAYNLRNNFGGESKFPNHTDLQLLETYYEDFLMEEPANKEEFEEALLERFPIKE